MFSLSLCSWHYVFQMHGSQEVTLVEIKRSPKDLFVGKQCIVEICIRQASPYAHAKASSGWIYHEYCYPQEDKNGNVLSFKHFVLYVFTLT
jgi:hypothetical protein